MNVIAKKEVQLIRTGITEGLSEPINYEILGKGNDDVVTVSMEEAIEFVQDLGEKETLARPTELKRDASLLDPHLGTVTWYSLWSKYTGRKIVGPSEDWWYQN